jgi:CubicO group peptidase (beta-lactamase class C family)
MTRSLTFLCATLVALAPSIVRAQSIDQKLVEYMSAREALGQFSGAILVAKNGRVLLSKGYGYADVDKKIRNTDSTKFRAASITKQFTAMAILRLREAGKLKLEDSICRYIDRCPAAWNAVTLAHLIHHSSGIPDYEEALDMQSEKYANVMARPGTDEILDSARVKPLDFPAGSKFHYSNTGYLLLSMVIEKVSGMKYPEYIHTTLLAPAGMLHSGLLPVGGQVPGIAVGYTPGRELSLTQLAAGIPFLDLGVKPVPEIDMSGIHGDGGLYTTVGDLNRWLTTLEDTTWFPSRLSAEYFTPGLANGAAPEKTGYAFGWIIDRDLGTTVRFHTGALPGFVSRMSKYPDSNLVVIVMANTDFSRLSRISRDLSAAAMGMPYDVPRSHVLIDRDSVSEEKLTGEYVLADGTVAKVSAGKSYLELAVPNRFTAGLLPETGSLFYVPFFEGTVRFDRDANGAVTQLVMHYNGTDRPARRKPG